MTLESRLETIDLTLTDTQERRIRRHLETLDRRFLAHRPEPRAEVVLRRHAAQRQVEVDLRVQLGPLGAHVVSHQSAETPDHAVRLAIEDVERQLERQQASLQGEPTYGVPSRRLPAALRPHPPTPSTPAPAAPGEEGPLGEAGMESTEEEQA